MKKTIFFTIILFLSVNLFAQSPNMFNYQAVFSDASDGDVVTFTIYEGGATGTEVFSETHNLVSDDNFNSSNGLVNLQIGNGTGSADLSVINWSTNTFFLNVNLAGTDKGTTQLISVPYAMHAKTAESIAGGNTHYVGELFGGGIVFYVDHTGEHGLIASLDDLSDNVAWSATTATEIGTNAQSYYNGDVNTAAIVAQDNTSGYAVTLCNNYSNDGFSDWYLPAFLELQFFGEMQVVVGKILENDGNSSTNGMTFSYPSGMSMRYWTSTEFDAENVLIYQPWSDYERTTVMKNSIDVCCVRAIRAF